MTLVIWKKIRTWCDVSIGPSQGAHTRTYSVTSGKELGEDTVEEFDLSRGANDLLIDIPAGTDLVLDTFKEVRVLANLT